MLVTDITNVSYCRYIESLAGRSLRELLSTVPTTAHKIQTRDPDPESMMFTTKDVLVDDLAVEDAVMVKLGELAPVDGVLIGSLAETRQNGIKNLPLTKEQDAIATQPNDVMLVDESYLTGETCPVCGEMLPFYF